MSRAVSVGSTAFRKGLYSLLPSVFEPNQDALEQELGRVETPAARVLDALLAKGAARLTEEERIHWARYIYLQLDRDPARVESVIENVLERQDEVHADPDRATGRKTRLDSDVRRIAYNVAKWTLISPDPVRDEWERALSKYTWRTARSVGAFITSDRPIVLDFGRGGPDTPSSLITMALSPDCLLFCYPSKWAQDFDLAFARDVVPLFNSMLIACRPRFVYSAGPLDQLRGVQLLPFLEHYLSEADEVADDGR